CCIGCISQQRVDCKVEYSDRITTGCCSNRIYISSCCIVWVTVPDIRKLVRTNYCIGCISQQRVDCKVEYSDRITTGCCSNRIYISSCCIVRVTIPDIRKLVRTNYCIGCISQQRVDCKVEYSDRITTGCCSQCIYISSCCIVWVTIPDIWKLVGTNCCIGCISQQRIDR